MSVKAPLKRYDLAALGDGKPTRPHLAVARPSGDDESGRFNP